MFIGTVYFLIHDIFQISAERSETLACVPVCTHPRWGPPKFFAWVHRVHRVQGHPKKLKPNSEYFFQGKNYEASNIIQHHPTSSNIIQHHPTFSPRFHRKTRAPRVPFKVTLPEKHSTPMLMVALGTGIAPMRAFIEEKDGRKMGDLAQNAWVIAE